jgi:hypothetical protein
VQALEIAGGFEQMLSVSLIHGFPPRRPSST